MLHTFKMFDKFRTHFIVVSNALQANVSIIQLLMNIKKLHYILFQLVMKCEKHQSFLLYKFSMLWEKCSFFFIVVCDERHALQEPKTVLCANFQSVYQFKTIYEERHEKFKRAVILQMSLAHQVENIINYSLYLFFSTAPNTHFQYIY